MGHENESQVIWTCPECSRNFRLPKSKPLPKLCVKCGKRARSSRATEKASADVEKMFFQEAESPHTSSLKFGVVAQPVSTVKEIPSRPTSTRDDANGTSIEELSYRMDEMLVHLEGITRTMKLVRWVVWGLGLATILSVVVTAGGLLYSISMFGSLGDLLNQPANGVAIEELPVGGGQGVGERDMKIPPQLRKNMKQIEDYSNTVNELLNEVNQ